MARPAVKVAELAIGYAHIGRIGIAVDDPGDLGAGHHLLSQLITHIHQCRGRGMLKEGQTFFGG